MEKEYWKDVIGYEGLYRISSFGRVKSLGNGGSNASKERIMKQGINKYGYYRICLCKDGKQKKYQVHRLVAQEFIDNPNNLPCVNHINEDKTDNRVENLEWCTQEYNLNYGLRNEKASKTLKGKQKSQETKEKLSKANKGKILSQETKEKISKTISITNQKPIVQFSKNNEFIKKWESAKEASEVLGVSRSNICLCLKGKTNSAGGFKWKYLEELKKAS